MANLRDIRKRRRSAGNTRKITRTMELVASAKLKKAQDAAAASRPYADALLEMVGNLSGGLSHPLMKTRPINSVVIVVCAADRGLCGSFNTNLVDLAMKRGNEHLRQGREVQFVCIGKKAASTLAFLGSEVAQSHSGIAGKPQLAKVVPIANALMDDFLAAKVDLVEVVYARFVSASRQMPDQLVLLPAGGADSAAGAKPAKAGSTDFITIPSPEELVAVIIPTMVRTVLYSAVLQTTAGEHSARRIAMKNASDAAGDMVKALTTVYNRGRQGKITQEIAEIVGAVEAMA